MSWIRANFPKSHNEILRVFADGDYVLLHVHRKRTPEARGDAIVDIFRLENRKMLSSDARCTPPAELISAWLIKTLGSAAKPAYSHLLDEERDQIAVMRAAGRSICAIARALHRAKSTVSRELRRNGLSSGRYSPLHAAGAYQLRRRREAILEKDQKLRTFVCDRLAEG